MKEISCAVIGAGRFGKHYVRLLGEAKGAKLVAVGGRENWQETIVQPDINAVIIATPVSTHFEIARMALEAGKHVLLEKPMTSTLAEAEGLERIVKAQKRIFLVSHQYLYNDYINRVKEEIGRGVFGKILYFFAEHLYPGPIRNDVGCFWETAPHELAIIDYLFRPEKILQSNGRAIGFYGNGRDDFASANVAFSGDLYTSLVVSWLAPEKVRRFTFVGEKGAAVFDERQDAKLKFYFPATTQSSFKDANIIIPTVDAQEPLRNQLEHFIRCIRNGEKPLTGIDHAMRVMKMLNVISKEIGS